MSATANSAATANMAATANSPAAAASATILEQGRIGGVGDVGRGAGKAIAAPAVAAPVTRQDDLIGWWKLDESSGTTAEDSTSGANDLTLVSMDTSSAWVAGKNGNCLDFDGTDDRTVSANVDWKTQMGSEFTVSVWWYPVGTGGIFALADIPNESSGSADGTPFIFLRQDATNNMDWYINHGYRITWSSGVDFNTWHHAAITYDGTTYKTYLDGSANGTYVGALGSMTGERVILGHAFSNYFEGKVEDFRIYDATLSATEIGDIYNSGSGDWG